MVTNRKKLKNRKRKFKLLFGFLATIVIIGGILGYLTYKTIFAGIHYISPLAKNIPQNYLQDEKATNIIMSQLKEEKIDYKSIKTADNLYYIQLKDDSEVIISSKKDLNTQISSLQFILSRLTMEGRQFKKLDLQFDKPIIILK